MTKVIYYMTASGENPVSDFLDSLEKRHQAKLLRIIKNIENYGLLSVIPHLKKLAGTPLWEIRILGKDSIRIIYVVVKDEKMLLLHGFIKKSNKTPANEIQIAINRFRDWVEINS